MAAIQAGQPQSGGMLSAVDLTIMEAMKAPQVPFPLIVGWALLVALLVSLPALP